jgi:DNA transformation protein and related proteins
VQFRLFHYVRHNLPMTTSRDFASYCCDLLASTGPCVAKRMFGGFGISTEGLNIALLVDLGEGDKLWLKADNLSRSHYEAERCARFTYDTKHGPRSVNYYSAPEEAMDSPDAMRPWAALALECAVRARASKAPAKVRTTSPKPPAKAKAVKAPKTPQAKLNTARAATKAVAKRAAPASTARQAVANPQVPKPTVKRAAAPAPKTTAARKSAKGASTAAQ